MEWLTRVFERFHSPFPSTVREHWYCGEWYMYCEDNGGNKLESPACGRVAFNPFYTGHAARDTSGLIDGLIPAIRIDDRIGLYRQVGYKYRKTNFYDGASWDDGYKIDMRFVRSIRIQEKAVTDG